MDKTHNGVLCTSLSVRDIFNSSQLNVTRTDRFNNVIAFDLYTALTK